MTSPTSPIIFRPTERPPIGLQRPTSVAVGGLAPVPYDIPVCWLSQPVVLRMEPPFTTAAITRDGATYRDKHDANRAEYGDFPFTATLETAQDLDPARLAHWTITYQSTPRVRSPQFTINLLYRSDTEKLGLLRIPRWSRIRLTGVPPEFPEGASSLILAGARHQISGFGRLLHITTAPVVGAAAGVPGPWFRLGSSRWGGTDVIPF